MGVVRNLGMEHLEEKLVFCPVTLIGNVRVRP